VADALGLLAMLGFIACVIALAAAVTWVVVRFTPAKSPTESRH
jgi:flagellar biogenesis protein FliO